MEFVNNMIGQAAEGLGTVVGTVTKGVSKIGHGGSIQLQMEVRAFAGEGPARYPPSFTPPPPLLARGRSWTSP